MALHLIHCHSVSGFFCIKRKKVKMARHAFNITRQDRYIRVTFEKGTEVTPEMIMEAVAQQNERFDMSRHFEIWDFRGCHPHAGLKYATIASMVNTIEKNNAWHWSPALAILVDSDLQFGLCRMFQIIANEYQPDIGIFTDAKEAQQWITEH